MPTTDRILGHLLDTNIVSETRKASGHGAVIAWFQEQPAERVFIPSIVFLELQRGAELTRRQDPEKAIEIERWIDQVASWANVLSFDLPASREYARMTRGRNHFISEDLMIAAIARVHALTIATRNVRDFEDLGVAVFNPFDYRRP